MAQPEPSSSTTPELTAPPSSGSWQAIFSPQYNSYYFYNTETKETTWQNPLDSSSSAATATEAAAAADEERQSDTPDPHSATSAAYTALEQAAIAQGIDPSLAHLDPNLAASGGTAIVPGSYAATAKFNARTGQFTRPEARDPSHMSEYERMKRMSEFYFDVAAWERQREQDQDADGTAKKKKKPTKKDLERFKEQKRLKKIAKTAWLRT